MGRWNDKTFDYMTDFVSVVIVCILLSFAVYWAIQKPIFWLRGVDVSVYGNQEAIKASLLADQLKGTIKGTFFTVDIQKIRDALKEIPWVRQVAVKREWPNRLQLNLYLYKPAALWGDEEVLAQDGTIFPANQAIAESEGELPRINGLKKDSAKIYQRFLDFEKVCEKYGFKAISLNLNPLSGWELTFKRPDTKNIEVIFKGTDTEEIMDKRLERILKSLPQMSNHFGAHPTRIDARYERGVAVERPEQETTLQDEAEKAETELNNDK